MPDHDDGASTLDQLFPPDGPALFMTARGEVLGHASADDQATMGALRGFLILADDLGAAHRPLQAVTALGEWLEYAQGRLTTFQAQVLLALYRGAAKLRGDDGRSVIGPVALGADDQARLLATCGSSDLPPLADLFAALVVSRVRAPVGGRAH
jgi:hypothetical protein